MADDQNVPESPDVHFDPIMKLPLVEVKTLEEDEEILFQMRGKLFRYDSAPECKQWKERGTGDIKILKHKKNHSIRILMRRDKTLKICANHLIRPYMELQPNDTCESAWIWSTMADFAEEEPKQELLAIKFGSVENAQKFKAAFDEAKQMVANSEHPSDAGEKDDSGSEAEDSEKEELENDRKTESDEVNNKESTNEAASDEKEQDTLSTQLQELSVTETNSPDSNDQT